jgi:hypothetical protein
VIPKGQPNRAANGLEAARGLDQKGSDADVAVAVSAPVTDSGEVRYVVRSEFAVTSPAHRLVVWAWHHRAWDAEGIARYETERPMNFFQNDSGEVPTRFQ